jgi:3-oxoacyl-[acyl-carrier protein] reductase
VALVSGGGRGIGLGIAQTLCRAGFRVALTDLDEASAVGEARSLPDAIGLRLDVSSAREWEAAVSATTGRWGRLDLLVNNAGISPRDSVEKATESDWDRTLNTNLRGAWLGTKTALPWLRESKGRIINIGSTHSTLPRRGLFTYSVSKAGLLGLTRQVALECLDDEVTCNMVAPGWVPSPGEVTIQRAEGRLDFPAGIARVSSPEDVGAVVLFLASPEARNVTGEVIHLDGGLHAFGDVGVVHFPKVGGA